MIILKFPIGNLDLHGLCNLHLLNDHYSDAIKVLKSIYWNSDECLHAMNLIYGSLITQKQDDTIERKYICYPIPLQIRCNYSKHQFFSCR